MRRALFNLAACCVLPFGALAGIHKFDVRGSDDQSPKSNKPGFSVVLVDSRTDWQMVFGVAAVPKTSGRIKNAVLLVVNEQGQYLARAVLAPQEPDAKSTDYEFNLRTELLKNSVLLVSYREGDDLHIAKFILGSFPVREHKK